MELTSMNERFNERAKVQAKVRRKAPKFLLHMYPRVT
jgi:hypothetical protein